MNARHILFLTFTNDRNIVKVRALGCGTE